ncbi:MAG: phage Gp37/Gp68 family protein [Acidimicrobiia bacterium]|nr:phage Gp37/Gp68 family protein [Acidimicrobiia bacterium]
MSNQTGIEWTETTWNPTTGRDLISPGCDNCYALTMAKRLHDMGQPKYQKNGDPRTSGPGFGLTLHPDTLEAPYRWKAPKLIFVNSMSDLFHPKVPLDFIRQVFQVMADTPRHTYQVLTKRSSRLATLAPELDWPENVWMGVSVENDRYAFRVNHLRTVPAAIRFVSAEPLLCPLPDLDLSGIHWVIVGGESGPRSRPMQESWAIDLRDKCAAADVAFFFKQWGGPTPKSRGRCLQGIRYSNIPRQRSIGRFTGTDFRHQKRKEAVLGEP